MNALVPRQLAQRYGAAGQLHNTQYHYAEPRLYTSQADLFVDAVGVALTEAHGNWWHFSTLRMCCAMVRLSNLPASGYGRALAGWIIHSGEVIPSPADTAHSYDPWWRVFGGLHSVVGYRTEMLIDDEVGGPYGADISAGAPVVGAWLQEVAAASAYAGGPTYHDRNRGITEPLGRPSTLSVCGHADDSIYDNKRLPPATCLQSWWIGN